MKIRTGFVSNSSSSSFILVGWKNVPHPTNEKEEEEWYSGNLGFTYFGEKGLLGICLADGEELPNGNIEISDVLIAFEKAGVIREKMGFTDAPKMIYGTRYC